MKIFIKPKQPNNNNNNNNGPAYLGFKNTEVRRVRI